MRSKEGGATVSFTTGMRLHSNTETFYKSARATWPGIILRAGSSGKSAFTSITFNSNMTPGLDVTYDAGLMGGDPAFRLFTRLVEDNGVNFMLQCLPDYDFEKMIVPLGVHYPNGGKLVFSAETFDLPASCSVILEDRLSGTFTNLEDYPVSDSIEIDGSEAETGRFYLHLSEDVTGLSNSSIPELKIFLRNQEIVIKGFVGDHSFANLYDLTGRMILKFPLYQVETNSLPVHNLPSGVYVLYLYGRNLNETARIFLD